MSDSLSQSTEVFHISDGCRKIWLKQSLVSSLNDSTGSRHTRAAPCKTALSRMAVWSRGLLSVGNFCVPSRRHDLKPMASFSDGARAPELSRQGFRGAPQSLMRRGRSGSSLRARVPCGVHLHGRMPKATMTSWVSQVSLSYMKVLSSLLTNST